MRYINCPVNNNNTYINNVLNCQSTIDYFLISDISKVCQFDIIDHDSNLSDHLPLHILCNRLFLRILVSLLSRTIVIAKFALNDFVGITETSCRTIMLLDNYCSLC